MGKAVLKDSQRNLFIQSCIYDFANECTRALRVSAHVCIRKRVIGFCQRIHARGRSYSINSR